MKMTFTAPFADSSGYAEFSRGFLTALAENPLPNFEFNADLLSYERNKTDHGVSSVLTEATRRKLKPDVNVICMIPPLFKPNLKPGCKNVGFTMWETTRLCDEWVKQCNEMDGILVPSKWNVEVFRTSGVKVPIAVAPPGITSPDVAPIARKDHFTFLSVFQWTPRKNPNGLLRAYWSEFCGNDNVELVLKTYGKNRSQEETNIITNEIEQVKASIQLPHYPRVRFITDLIPKSEMKELYRTANVFVLPHRGEAWSMGHFEAMAYGKPVIGTGFGGNLDFMRSDNSHLLNYTLGPVHSQNSFMPVYDGRGLWAEADLKDLMVAMRWLYEDPAARKELGTNARKEIATNWTQKLCAEKFVAALKEVLK